MRHVQVMNVPRRIARVPRYGLPEECQFEAEPPPVPRLEISGVIPPLRPVVGMIEVIVRKLVLITWQSLLVVRCTASACKDANQNQKKTTPHAPPRSDSTAEPRERDIGRRARWPHRQC